MKDTSERFEALVADRHRQMTPEQRVRAAAAMFDAGRVIVDASLPPALQGSARRLAIARRLYGDSLPSAALAAHAAWSPPSRGAVRGGGPTTILGPRLRGDDEQEDSKHALDP